MAEPAESQTVREPRIVQLPVNPSQVQSIGVGGVQFNTQTILQSPFFWMMVGAAGAWFVVYSINQQKKK